MNLSQLPVYTVSQINGYLKELMEADPLLQSLLIRGEISNYKKYPSGHHYFSLKDDKGSIRCVLFRGDALRLRFQPANGMNVLAFGRISVFPRDGQYQMYCTELIEDGRGALDLAFERLRKKLEGEGLFDPERKQPLPDWPGRIALVTSPAGAAVRDMIRILGARWPMTGVLVVPVRVQGEGAAQEIAAAIDQVNRRQDIGLIITGRGGGSREDLWAFNEECVARAIARSRIPVISAVGHEPDVTISDYVADVRAATPSNAAELAVPDQAQVRRRLEQLSRRLAAAQQGRLTAARKDLRRLASSRVLRGPKAFLEENRLLVDRMEQRLAAALKGRGKDGRLAADRARERLNRALQSRLKDARGSLARLSTGLDAMSPLKVLGRGYAIARTAQGVITRADQARAGQQLDVMFTDATLRCEVKEKEATEAWQARN